MEKAGNLQTDAKQLFLFVPIPAKAKKLGLLSIYKFSMVLTLPDVIVIEWSVMPCVPYGAGETAEDDQQLHDVCQSLIVKIL